MKIVVNMKNEKDAAIKITEAPRDAMQGIKQFIPTQKKADLINAILKVGFDIVDFGSFVSPKAIPQLKDTAEVVKMLDLSQTNSMLMAIVGNSHGAETATDFDEVDLIGYPFSFSKTFLQLNINSNIEKAEHTIDKMQEICVRKNKKLLVYLSMAFGNPYGDPWHPDLIVKWTQKLCSKGIEIIALSDIIGAADGKMVQDVFETVYREVPCVDIGLHLHTREHNWREKVAAAYSAGCRRFDGVMSGMGGCPMAGYELVGNLNTRHLLQFCNENNIPHRLNEEAFEKAYAKAVMTY
jgi:hydroxymethylglutaryl-CoA lyase